MNRSDCRKLEQLIGGHALIALAEAHGGTRLYVPRDPSALVALIGKEPARTLAERFGSLTILVPLVRDLRARHHRLAGRSNAEIARRLGVTERAIERIFAAMDNPPAKGRDQRQGELFR